MRLKANDWKGGSEDSNTHYLWGRLYTEQAELYHAIFPPWKLDQEKVVHEAADIANFAMMIADNYNRDGFGAK